MKRRDKFLLAAHSSKVFQGALALGILGVGVGVIVCFGVPAALYRMATRKKTKKKAK